MAQLLTPNALKELDRQRYDNQSIDPNITNKIHDYIYEPKPIMSAKKLIGEWQKLLSQVEDPEKTIFTRNVLVQPEYKKLWNSFIKSTSKTYDINEALIELSKRYKEVENPIISEPRMEKVDYKETYKRGGMIHFGNIKKHTFN
jgi:hypothetical protein